MTASSSATASARSERIRARIAEYWQRHLADAGVLHLQVLGIREFGRHDGETWKALIEELSAALGEQRELMRQRIAELN